MFCVAPHGKIRIKGWEFQSEMLQKVAEESKHQTESVCQEPWLERNQVTRSKSKFKIPECNFHHAFTSSCKRVLSAPSSGLV